MPTGYKPLVAIQCLVYNHEPYLRDCFEGFVMQKTNFRFVAIVHDDCSTDHSTDIIREYAVRYPDIFIPMYETENQYSKHDGSLEHIMNEATIATGARYIAVCEGDDYWTDPLKLQKQIDILESNESLMACCTNSSIVDKDGNILKNKFSRYVVKDNKQGRYTLRDYLNQVHAYPTASVVYRRAHFDEICAKSEVMRNPYMGDWTLWIAILCFGDMYYLDEVTCAYRINPTSVTHTNTDVRRLGYAKENLRLMPAVASILPDDYQDIKDDLIHNTGWIWYNIANGYRHMHNYFMMTICALICATKDPKLLYLKIKNRINREYHNRREAIS